MNNVIGRNWGRGFLRLWIVVSVLWVLFLFLAMDVVGTIRDRLTYSPLQNTLSLAPVGTTAIDPGHLLRVEMPDGTAYQVSGQTEAEAQRSFEAVMQSYREANPSGYKATSSPDFTPLRAQALVIAKVRRADRDLFSAALFAAIPIVGTLLLGLAARWVLRGFRTV